MPTSRQEDGFIDYVISDKFKGILIDAIYWISRNLNPQDVFSESDLEQWAEDNDYIKNPY